MPPSSARRSSAPADPEAAARAFVAAGRQPADPANLDRIPFVKICGITDAAGIEAAVRAGADAIGLNLVPGTPRALQLSEAAALAARLSGRCPAPGRGPSSWRSRSTSRPTS